MNSLNEWNDRMIEEERQYQHDKCVQRGDVLDLIDVLQQHYAAMDEENAYVTSESVARDMQRLALRVLELSHGDSAS